MALLLRRIPRQSLKEQLHSSIYSLRRFAVSHSDHLQTAHALTNSGKQVVWSAQQAAFGAMAINADPDGDGTSITYNPRFPGQIFDSETGLYYNWHRYYDPTTGRYITSDPIGLRGGLNTYGYAFQNPLKYTDPTGLIAWECTSFKTAGGVGPLDVGQIIYTCKSECVAGKRTVAQIQVLLTGPGFGLGAEMTGSNSTFTDGNKAPNTNVFGGSYTEVSAGASYGIGYGFGMGSFNRGAAKGSLSGIQGGIGLGIGEASGPSNVVWEREEDCGSCEK